MKIFISWSGKKSKKIAVSLREWLPNVIQALEPWMSSEDIDKGTRWYIDVISELEKSHFGIICLTSDNIESSWIHFEAGALSKSLDQSLVCPYLFEIEHSMIKGPLVQFQAAKSTKEDTNKLLHSINRAMADKALLPEKLDITFERWWPDLDEKFKQISSTVESQMTIRKDRELIEEILELARSLSRHIIPGKPELMDEEGFLRSPEFIKILQDIGKSYQNLTKEDLYRIRKYGALE